MTARIDDIIALTRTQESWLLHSLRSGGTDPAVVQTRCRIRGDLAAEAFRGAWRRVVDHHAALRTSVEWEGVRRPVQVVHGRVELPIVEHDWRGLDAEAARGRWQALVRDGRQRGFDLRQPPLFRLDLVRTGDDEHRLLWTLHHLVLDGWSAHVVLRQVLRTYASLSDGEPPSTLPGASFRHYVDWERRQDFPAAKRYWRERLEGVRPTLLCEPVARGSGTVDAGTPSRLTVLSRSLSPPTGESVEAASRRQEVTVTTLLAGAWALALGRWLDRPDVTYGMTVSGRPAELEDVGTMVGHFANVVPCPTNLPAEGPLSPWLREIQRLHVASFPYHHCAPGAIQAGAGLDSRPLYDSILVVENHGAATPLPRRVGGLEISELDGEIVSKYPVNAVVLREENLRIELHHDSHRLSPSAAEQLLDSWAAALAGMCSTQPVTLRIVLDTLPRPSPTSEAGAGRSGAGAEIAKKVEVSATADWVERMAAIWRRRLDVDRIEGHHNFFDLGGDSLTAVEVLDELEREIGVRVEIGELVFDTFEQVVESCASRLARDSRAGRSRGASGSGTGSRDGA